MSRSPAAAALQPEPSVPVASIVPGAPGAGGALGGAPSAPDPPGATDPGGPESTGSAADAAGLGLVAALSQVLGSQAVLIGTGLACLPVLARNLGPGLYGGFSLYLVVLGLAAQLDVFRPLLVREYARGAAAERDLRPDVETIGLVNLLGLALVGAAGGTLLLGPLAGPALAVGLVLHALAGRRYALLAAAGRIGRARAARNFAWAAATLATAGLSFLHVGAHAWLWCFPAANLAILIAHGVQLGGARPLGVVRPRWNAESWERHAAAVKNVLGHSLAVMVLVAADRALLRWTASPLEAGRYMGQYDLALKVHVLSSALGFVLYPALSHAVATRGEEQAARWFVRVTTRVTLAYFAGLLALVLLHRPIVRLVLGAEFAGSAAYLPLLLVGVFVGLLGFLVTSWQRARGDFATHRRAYSIAAALMVAVGCVLIPRYGATGAVLTFLTARSAEVLVVAAEVRHLSPAVLPRGRVAALAGLVLALALAAAAVSASPGASLLAPLLR